jgi:hypothetical protein
MAYIPKNKIITDLTTSGTEFVFKDTTDYYSGPYYKLYNGKFYTGQNQNFPGTKEIIRPTDNKTPSGVSVLNSIAQSPLFPTEQDYKKGVFTRYFIVKRNEPIFIEIEKKVYDKYVQRNSQVPWQLYKPISLFWELVGDVDKIAQINKNMTTLLEQKEQAFGLGLYLEENWVQYYKENS